MKKGMKKKKKGMKKPHPGSTGAGGGIAPGANAAKGGKETTPPKGQGKGKGKNSKGQPFCFSWGRGRDGDCKDLPPKSQCKNGRVHQCEFCESPDHKSKDCPKKPKTVKW